MGNRQQSAGGAAVGASAAAHGPERGAENGTRARVARLILEHGPITAAMLGERLGLTPAAIRRHLDNLMNEGMVEARDSRDRGRRGRGRPARVFAITDAGRDAFVHGYDDLAASALRFLAEKAGSQAVAEFARSQVADLERRYRPMLAAAPPQQRIRLLAEALSSDGYAASAGEAPAPGGGDQLCQHHCPVAHVATEFPELCEAEVEVFERLLGTPVRRLATIAHGDGVCTTHVTPRDIADAEPRPAGSPDRSRTDENTPARPGARGGRRQMKDV
ncbi:metalloregulator ArsR/SmtB family transcription factor [Streptomonospora sp. DSM 45055]|uniref:Metalloregulator ArsR/SmtB family transcription factor n=1 Tax=Streptomonospora wellingtoniae TaxID=3075544 RepID=A0ABU2KWI3_9ACTN|nr:metalloregulator ArsR/SmtB family transcription factor [Streptomonospora sp. DSM 45055]MDT0303532.1 metalloregulator ArsR/SmtB family transcription factor [Streptomonospora sp. DSM 45055]